MNRDEFHGVKIEVEEMKTPVEYKYKGIQRGDPSETALRASPACGGVSRGKGVTMAEVDAYYEGLLRELEELQKIVDSNVAHSSKDKTKKRRRR